jgi:hypothetical protein
MAQTPIILLAMDYLLKGDGLAPSTAVTEALAACAALRDFTADADEEGGGTPEWAADLELLPRETVLANVEARIERLLETGENSEQGIRRFISIFQAASGATSMTNGILDSAAALKAFKSFTDFGPNINNIQDLVTGGKTGSFPGGAMALTKLGDGLKGVGSMYDSSSLANMGKASSLIQNLSSQGALPASVTERLGNAGIDIDNITSANESTLKKILSEVQGTDLQNIGTITRFPTGKLGSLGDALSANKVLPAGALAAIPSAASTAGFSTDSLGGLGSLGSISGLGSMGSVTNLGGSLYKNTSDGDLTYTGDDHIVWDRVNSERRSRGLSSLSDIGSPRPDEGTESVASAGSGDLSSLGTGLETVAGTGSFSEIGNKLSKVRVPELKHLMAAPPDFSTVSDSLKSKFTTIPLPNMSSTEIPGASREGLAALFSQTGMSPSSSFSIPSIPGHIPKVPSIPGVPSIPLQIPGFAPGGGIDTSLYTKTPDDELTYTGDDYIVWDRVNTERLNRGLPDLAALGSPRPEGPASPPTATPNGTPGVFQMLGTISSEGPILPYLEYLAQVSATLPDEVDVDAVSEALANIQIALDQEEGALVAAGIDLKYPGPTGYMGVTAFAEKLHQIGVDKLNLGLDRFIEELALAADSPGGDSVIAALYEGKNLVA